MRNEGMAGRRETRNEREVFVSRLLGKSVEERHRLMSEHRAFLSGERETDADFGAGTPSADEDAVSEPQLATPTASTLSARRPPIGKEACYRVAMAKRDVAAKKSSAPGKKKVTKRQEAELRRQGKQAKEARAMTRVTDATAARTAAKKSQREEMAAEEQRGQQARDDAVAQLQRRVTKSNKKVASAARKRKTTAKVGEKGKKKKRTSPHVVGPDSGGAGDDSAGAASSSAAESVPLSDRPLPQTEDRVRIPARSLVMDAGEHTVSPNAADPPDDTALNSDVEGEIDTDEWYTEDAGSVDSTSEEDEDPAQIPPQSELGEGSSGPLDEVSDDDCDGKALLRREKKKARRELDKQRLASAKAKLTRNWDTTRDNWDVLTKDEMEVLALDDEALQKLRHDGWNFDASTQPKHSESYPDLYTGSYEPTAEVLELTDSPLQLFFFFMPRRLWRRIATESNRYYHQNLNGRVDRMYAAQQERGENASREEILLRETKNHKKIQPEDILHCIGLLVARMLCPHKRKFSGHWGTTSVGAVPKGIFGQFVPKTRFNRIMQNLHFTNNADPRAETDRAWKIRSVVDTLQETFAKGYNTPPVLSFDEGMIPSKNRHNTTRQFMKDKPHKWGTKVFMTCCAETTYCVRIEIFCGTDQHSDELGGKSPTQFSADPNSGPAAVMRNLLQVLPPQREGVFHAVITDRFYTSVQLSLQLLARNVYTVGTIQTNKKGFPPALYTKATSRPAGTPRGDTTVAVAKCCPKLQVLRWWDRLPVYLLSTGSSTTMEMCARRIAGGRKINISCPSAMRDYHRWMGGVDNHDQLRLQRYSLQLSVRFRKYYKSLFLGLVDMALVNTYIVYISSTVKPASSKDSL
ncbi:Hypothetical protein PHPALM_12564 [Phytophthora palmivora]|uniref:PiggyBac transposable element-derived protein domain-containing protein n=1 Tax=Phytophthora palmivora TaxID=4796 RepID=A0A2P4XZH5_9STRA|nr:Hypothetical protein PHPALM_12564 [Phytophthora palmivora]